MGGGQAGCPCGVRGGAQGVRAHVRDGRGVSSRSGGGRGRGGTHLAGGSSIYKATADPLRDAKLATGESAGPGDCITRPAIPRGFRLEQSEYPLRAVRRPSRDDPPVSFAQRLRRPHAPILPRVLTLGPLCRRVGSADLAEIHSGCQYSIVLVNRHLKRVIYTSDRLKALPVAGRALRALERSSRTRDPQEAWFWDHYQTAARQVVEFCRGDVAIEGSDIADIGCGDGIIALGMAHRVRPRVLVGFDIVPTNSEILIDRARKQRVARSLPSALEFRQSAPTELPASDDSFDFVYSWSAFEHIADPLAVLTEIHRILRPNGAFFLQLWPFYLSPDGSHLQDWCPEEFHHLVETKSATIERVRGSSRHDKDWTEIMIREYERLNRLTVSDLQQAVHAAGFEPRILQLLPKRARLSPALDSYAWSDLGIGGIKLLATPSA